MCHPEEETAIERGIDGAHFFGFSLAYYYAFGEHSPGRSNVWREFEERRDEVGFARDVVTPERAPLGVRLLQEGFGSLRGAIGTPEQVTELIERYEAAGVDQVIFVAQAGPNRHEHVCESLELFGEEVLPRFAERASAREEEKRERLAEALDRALARRAPARESGLGYVVRADGEPAPARSPVISVDGERRAALSARDLLNRAGEAALAALVRGRSDAQLRRLFYRGPGLDAIFKGMEAAFVPERAAGFEGDVQYELRARDGIRRWVISIRDGTARSRRGSAARPVLLLRLDIADFVRLAARETYAPRLFLRGAIEVEGDVRLAGRLDEMFGGRPAT
jgi:hypothetical protein